MVVLKERNVRSSLSGLGRRFRRVEVDLRNRVTKSFGKPVQQHVEIHYRGKPFSFMYDDNIEQISIDVVKNDPMIKADGEIHFDDTKRRMDISDAFVGCSCGVKYDAKIPTSSTTTNAEALKEAIKSMPDMLKHDDPENGHKLSLLYVETNTEIIPKDKRMKNFNPERINYYRLFSKKTLEVKYLATYGQDLLAEAPQDKYADSSQGRKAIGMNNFLFMLFIMGLIEVFTYMIASSSSNYYNPNPQNNFPWYVLIGVVILMFSATWRLHVHDISRSTFKNIELRSAPFYISNRGVLPVIMINSTLTDVWDYQSDMMNIDDTKAKEVMYALQTWSDNQINELERSNFVATSELELVRLANETKDLSNINHGYANRSDPKKADIKNIVLAVMATAFAYTFILYAIGLF